MRRKSRSHHEMWVSKTKNEDYLQTPRRAHKKLRGRKVHKLMLLAPEVVKDDLSGNIAGIATGLIQHFEGLSMVEAGPSSTTTKKTVHSPTPMNTNNKVSLLHVIEPSYLFLLRHLKSFHPKTNPHHQKDSRLGTAPTEKQISEFELRSIKTAKSYQNSSHLSKLLASKCFQS